MIRCFAYRDLTLCVLYSIWKLMPNQSTVENALSDSRWSLLTLVIISFGVHKLYNSMESYMSFLGLFSMILCFFSESLSLLLIIIFCCFETRSHVVQAGLKLITLLLHLLCVEITGLHDNTWSIRVSWSILIMLSLTVLTCLILLLFSLFLF